MNIGQKVSQMKADLIKIVNLCNDVEDYRMATSVQSCLQTVGGLSTQLGEEQAKEIAKAEFK